MNAAARQIKEGEMNSNGIKEIIIIPRYNNIHGAYNREWESKLLTPFHTVYTLWKPIVEKTLSTKLSHKLLQIQSWNDQKT